jgi:hypothetical protein
MTRVAVVQDRSGRAATSAAADCRIIRPRSDLDVALSAPEAEGLKTLAPRAKPLVSLVSQIAGQPTR